MHRPRFSVIIPHYQGVITHKRFCLCVESLAAQTFKDYEVLCYHDGPLLDRRLPMPLPVRATESRTNDWGHSLRDRGIREASGEYILHLNSDNILYPNALELIDKESRRKPRAYDEDGRCLDGNDIIIFPVIMRGLQICHKRLCRWEDPDIYTIFTGVPVKLHNIDCMQLVMRRERWLEVGGWYDKTHDGDGLIYEAVAAKFGYRTVPEVLGEHW